MARISRDWLPILAFALLCVLAGSRWMTADAVPAWGSTLRTEALACALLACVCAAAAHRRARPGSSPWRSALAGAGVFAGPAAGAILRGAAANSFNRTAAMCFVPVILTVSGWSLATVRRPLWPALSGIAASLLLLPLGLQIGFLGYVGLFVPAMAATAGLMASPEEHPGWREAAWLLAGGACGLATLEAIRAATSTDPATPLTWQGTSLDAILFALAAWSLLRLGAMRYATRFFAVPLVTVVEGWIIYRPELSGRLLLGVACFAAAIYGIWKRPAAEHPTLSIST